MTLASSESSPFPFIFLLFPPFENLFHEFHPLTSAITIFRIYRKEGRKEGRIPGQKNPPSLSFFHFSFLRSFSAVFLFCCSFLLLSVNLVCLSVYLFICCWFVCLFVCLFASFLLSHLQSLYKVVEKSLLKYISS